MLTDCHQPLLFLMSNLSHYNNPISNPFWAETEDVTLLEAALLYLGVEPFDMVEYAPEPGEADNTTADIAASYQAISSTVVGTRSDLRMCNTSTSPRTL